MIKKILIGLAITALGLIASSFMLAWTEDVPGDLQSVITGCGVIAEADPADCMVQCYSQKAECMSACGPPPDSCWDGGWYGPECQAWLACRRPCNVEFRACRAFCRELGM